MAFTKSGFKDHNWSHLEEGTNREERRREEEEEEEEKPRSSQQGMETTLSMDFVWITWNLRLDMVNILSLNLGF